VNRPSCPLRSSVLSLILQHFIGFVHAFDTKYCTVIELVGQRPLLEYGPVVVLFLTGVQLPLPLSSRLQFIVREVRRYTAVLVVTSRHCLLCCPVEPSCIKPVSLVLRNRLRRSILFKPDVRTWYRRPNKNKSSHLVTAVNSVICLIVIIIQHNTVLLLLFHRA